MLEPNQEDLERLWENFLENANKLGFVVKSNDEINFRPKWNDRNAMAGRCTLSAPSDPELVEMDYKPAYTLSKDLRKKYEKKNKNENFRRISK